jgi:hypothetical protein
MRCRSVVLALAVACQIEAASLSVSGNSAISGTAGTLASNLMGYYDPANVGVLPAPYYWWEAAGMWGAMLDYWHYTGDSQYNDQVAQAIISQAGSQDNFVGPYTQVRRWNLLRQTLLTSIGKRRSRLVGSCRHVCCRVRPPKPCRCPVVAFTRAKRLLRYA